MFSNETDYSRIAIYENGDIDAYVTQSYTVPTAMTGITSTSGFPLGDIGPDLYDFRSQLSIPLLLTATRSDNSSTRSAMDFTTVSGSSAAGIYMISYKALLSAMASCYDKTTMDVIDTYGGQQFIITQTIHTRIPFLMDRLDL